MKKKFGMDAVQVLESSAQSSDLNPIENIGKDEMNKNRNIQDKITEVCRIISEHFIIKLVSSMSRRCANVIANKGYAINY